MTIRESEFIQAARKTKLSPQSIKAARMVMVLGVGYATAAKRCGIPHRQAVYRAVNCIRRSMVKGDRCCVCGHAIE